MTWRLDINSLRELVADIEQAQTASYLKGVRECEEKNLTQMYELCLRLTTRIEVLEKKRERDAERLDLHGETLTEHTLKLASLDGRLASLDGRLSGR
jgi:DNA polymerase/3'-5' exonuclease PolX